MCTVTYGGALKVIDWSQTFYFLIEDIHHSTMLKIFWNCYKKKIFDDFVLFFSQKSGEIFIKNIAFLNSCYII